MRGGVSGLNKPESQANIEYLQRLFNNDNREKKKKTADTFISGFLTQLTCSSAF